MQANTLKLYLHLLEINGVESDFCYRDNYCIIMINFQVPQSELDSDLVKSILAEYKIHNADITLRL